MKLSTVLVLLGLVMFGSALSITPYKDPALFMERYKVLPLGQNAEYSKLRDEHLTPKFLLQDYGGTFIMTAIGVFLVARRGWANLNSPRSRATLFILAFVAPCLTVGAYIFDLLLRFERGEFPIWSDPTGIPLMYAPALLVILVVWAGAHLVFVRGGYRPEQLIQAASFKSNWWLLFIAAITTVFIALSFFAGKYWFVLPGVIWMYFYVSLAAVRRSIHGPKPSSQLDLTHRTVRSRKP